MVTIADRIGVVLVGTDGVPYEIGASSGGVSQADNSAFTAGTDSGTPVEGLYEATPSSITDGRVGVVGITSKRVLKAALHDAAGAAITTLPVSLTSTTVTGTVAVTQSGTWDEVGINDSGNSLTVDNGGTFAVQADGSVASGSSDSGAPVKVGAKYNSTRPVFTDGQRGDLQLDTRGNLGVTILATSSGASISDTTNGLWVNVKNSAAIPVTDNSSSLSVDWNGTQPVTGSGNATGALRVELANNGTGLVGLNAGTNAIGKLAANSGVDIGDVDVTSISAGSNLIGDVGIQPRTSNGLSTFMASGSDGSSILVATAQAIKASAGQLYGYYAFNPEAATTFVHFYNTAAASVTVGTTNPLFTLAIPAGAAANLMTDVGIVFSNAGWSCAATTTAGGNTAPSTGVSLVCWFK